MAHETSHIYLPIPILLIFLLHLPILKVLCVQLEWLKSLNFEGPHFGAPNFVKCYLSFIFVYSESFTSLA